MITRRLDAYDPADVVAALGPVLGEARAARLDAVAAARLTGVACVLDDLRDPHNGGAALRSCEAMGVLRVHVLSVRQRFRTSTKVTQGCEKWIDVARHRDVPSLVTAVRAQGYRLLVAVPGATLAVGDLDPLVPTALAFGNEHLGITPALRDAADGAFAIPMHGCSQSFNVSVSVAVALHVLTEARRRALGKGGDLDERGRFALRARYYARDLRGAEEIVQRYLARRP